MGLTQVPVSTRLDKKAGLEIPLLTSSAGPPVTEITPADPAELSVGSSKILHAIALPLPAT